MKMQSAKILFTKCANARDSRNKPAIRYSLIGKVCVLICQQLFCSLQDEDNTICAFWEFVE